MSEKFNLNNSTGTFVVAVINRCNKIIPVFQTSNLTIVDWFADIIRSKYNLRVVTITEEINYVLPHICKGFDVELMKDLLFRLFDYKVTCQPDDFTISYYQYENEKLLEIISKCQDTNAELLMQQHNYEERYEALMHKYLDLQIMHKQFIDFYYNGKRK